MSTPPVSANIVVGLRLFVDVSLNMFRVEATVQSRAQGISIYNQTFAYRATWVEVLAWLTALLSEADASATVGDFLS